MQLQGMIFDLDGTLGNTLPVCYEAFRVAFQAFLNRRFTDEEITRLFGPTEAGIIQRLVPDRWQACLRVFLDAYDRAHRRYAEPFAGIEPALRTLRQRGVALAIVTGKGADSAAISLRYLGIAPFFDVISTGSPEGDVKPLQIRQVLATWGVAPERVAYVGDTGSDMRAARKAGVIPLGARWAATSDVSGLDAEAPLATFSTVADFAQWIESHIEPNGHQP